MAALCALALALAGAQGAAASPSRYIYEQCDAAIPGGNIASAAFASYLNGEFVGGNTCALPGGGLSILQAKESSDYAYWTVRGGVPAGGRMEAITVTASVCTTSAAMQAFVYRPDWPSNCRDEARTYREEAPLPVDFYVWLDCTQTALNRCPAGSRITARNFAITFVDPVSPSIAQLTGAPFAGSLVRGRQSLAVSAADRGGGVAGMQVRVNGAPIGPPRSVACQIALVDNLSVSGVVATAVAPCPGFAESSWTLDTGAYPAHNGLNTIEACVWDFSTLGDPNATCSAPRAFQVDNSCVESPVGGGASLGVQFADAGGAETTVEYGERATITGRLVDAAGAPVGGAVLCLSAQVLGDDAPPPAVAAVTTDPSGRYAYRVPPGPNRLISIGYRSNDLQFGQQVRVNSRVEPGLAVAPRKVRNGGRVRFRGRLPGPSAAERVVVLQASVVGAKRWLTFRRATTGPHGGFRASYQFTATRRRTNYRFRAIVPRQSGYPWIGGQSRPVRVLVRP